MVVGAILIVGSKEAWHGRDDDLDQACAASETMGGAPLACLGTKVRANSLITRFSSLERRCEVSAGTVIEDTFVLADTYLGKGSPLGEAVCIGAG